MGLLLSRLPGRQKDALTQFETALRLKPDDAKLQCDLADFLVGQPGSAHEAIVHYEAALRINPNCSEARTPLSGCAKRTLLRWAEISTYPSFASDDMRQEPTPSGAFCAKSRLCFPQFAQCGRYQWQ